MLVHRRQPAVAIQVHHPLRSSHPYPARMGTITREIARVEQPCEQGEAGDDGTG
jgi:hypothetical protein